MNTKVSMLIMSALSDAQELNGIQGKESKVHRLINYAKWLMLVHPNTDVEVKPDNVYGRFCCTPFGKITIMATNIE